MGPKIRPQEPTKNVVLFIGDPGPNDRQWHQEIGLFNGNNESPRSFKIQVKAEITGKVLFESKSKNSKKKKK